MLKFLSIFFIAFYLLYFSPSYAGIIGPFRLTEDISAIVSKKVQLSRKDAPYSQIENWVGNDIEVQIKYVGRLQKGSSLEEHYSENINIPKRHEIIFTPDTEISEDYSIAEAIVDGKIVFDKTKEKPEDLISQPIWNLHIFNGLSSKVDGEHKTAQINILHSKTPLPIRKYLQ